ncbi:hypothetical protein SAY87_026338 [Trapa incisa]|uniref:5-formyltetrahydrofolate cyclo-ligase n=1 Tax=Trapa incisa TaxID=236973 RepID=A0AAN7GMX7_9MYRT|nr:hypothetical protein SAY87_026338 [Trapa incisa]
MGCLSAISVISVSASRFLTSPSFFLSRPRHIRSISRLAFIASSSLVGLRSFSITMDGGDSNGNRGDQKLGADLDAVFNEKRVLRSKVRKALRSMDPLHRSFEDDAIQRIVLDAQWFRSSQRLCAYISCSALREVDTSKILSEILRNPSHDSDSQVHKSKKVYVPRVEDNNCHMRMLNILSVDDLIANSMNILEPAPVDADGNEREDVMHTKEPIDLFILPGLAFDRSGRRLGRGGGYYDTFLKNYQDLARARNWKQPLFVALSYSVQIMNDGVVPVAQFDVPVDAIVTPAGVIDISLTSSSERMKL